jgi:hypothetical protein
MPDEAGISGNAARPQPSSPLESNEALRLG